MNRRGIDHVVVMARDMDLAAERYTRLGFQLTPRMQHPFGTCNNLMMFQNSFLEILGVDRPAHVEGVGALIQSLVDQKEGVSHFALQSENVEADRREFLEKGLAPSDVSGFERAVTLPDGRRINAVVTVCTLDNTDTPRVLLFVSRQHVKEAVWVPEWQVHANGALDVACVTVISDQPRQEFEDSFVKLFGAERVSATDSAVVANTTLGRIEALTSERAAERFAGAILNPETVLPYVAAMSIQVESLERARRAAESGGVKLLRLEGGGLLVSADDANGVALEFVEN